MGTPSPCKPPKGAVALSARRRRKTQKAGGGRRLPDQSGGIATSPSSQSRSAAMICFVRETRSVRWDCDSSGRSHLVVNIEVRRDQICQVELRLRRALLGGAFCCGVQGDQISQVGLRPEARELPGPCSEDFVGRRPDQPGGIATRV